MKTRAAVLWDIGKDWSVEEIELDSPKGREVQVGMRASGLCHTDDHLHTGDFPMALPVIGGHEGAGVVEAVGPDVTSLAEGDHVIFQFVPSCGQCPPCVSGFQNLCDRGAHLTDGWQLSDQTARHHAGDADVRLMCLLGTFAEHTVVHEDSCIKVDDDMPLDKGCLLACGVLTGWGSAVYSAKVRPGDDVAVIGVGGVGINAVQGAKLAGAHRIFAIDPVAFKREQAVSFGATHTAASVEEAVSQIADETRGRMCHNVIMTVGVGRGEHIAPALAITSKRGRVVVTNVHPAIQMDVKMSMLDLTMMEKRVVGCLLGSAKARTDVPRMIQLYRDGQLKLDELITNRYSLDQINSGYADLMSGGVLRAVVEF